MKFFKHLVMLALAAGVLLTVEYKGTAAKGQAIGQVAGRCERWRFRSEVVIPSRHASAADRMQSGDRSRREV